MGEKVKITAEEWAAKARDKIECYHQVASVFGAYLPPMEHITSWHLRDLANGTKKMIKGTEIQHLHVPMYEHLAIDDFVEFIQEYPFVMMCLPDRPKELRKLGRQYLVNVIYTRLGDKFKLWVDGRINARHEEVKVEGKKYIELDAEIAKLFHASKAVSTTNGSAYHLFKATAKRRRTKQEIKDQELAEAAKKLDIEMKLKQLEGMQQQVAKMQQQIQNQQQVQEQAEFLYEQGLFKQREDGEWAAVGSLEEQ